MSRANDQVIEQDRRGYVTRGQVMGYVVRMGPVDYLGTRDGRPFSLAAALAAINGVGDCSIVSPMGRVVVRHGL